MKFFLMMLQMIPAIIALVRQIETVMPGKGLGPAKLDLVLNTVGAAAQGSSEVAAALEGKDMKAAVTGIVNTTVSTLNAAGVFPKQP